MLHRICTRCIAEKPLTLEFFKSSKESRGGLNTICRQCSNEYSRTYKLTHRVKFSERRRERYAAQNGEHHKALEVARAQREPFKCSAENLIDGLRDRAKQHGYDVSPDLRTKHFVENWLRRQPNCECCNVRFHIGRKFSGRKSDASPSFDRFDLTKGYTLENTALICWRCNNIKRNYASSDLRLVANWIDQRVQGDQTDPEAIKALNAVMLRACERMEGEQRAPSVRLVLVANDPHAERLAAEVLADFMGANI